MILSTILYIYTFAFSLTNQTGTLLSIYGETPNEPQDTISSDSLDKELPTVDLEEFTITEVLNNRDAVKESILVTKKMREGTNSAIALLGNIPGIQLDRISESIKIGLESNIPILIDGKETSIDYAKSISPERIRKVEIIRQPQGRYSEYPTVVNLILQSTFQGWDVGLQAKGMMSVEHKNSNSENGNINLSYSSDKWNAYTNLGYTHRHVYETTAYEREIAGNMIKTTTTDPTHPNQQTKNDMANLFFGLDYKINHDHRLSLQASGSIADNTFSEYFQYSDRYLYENIRDKYKTQEYAAGLFYDGIIGEKFTLSSEVYYDYYRNNDKYSYLESAMHDYGTDLNAYDKEPVSYSEIPTLGKKHYALAYIEATYSILSNFGIKLNDMLTYRQYSTLDKASGIDTYNSTEYRNKGDLNIFWNLGRRFSLNGGFSLLTVNTDYSTNRNENATNTTWSPLPYARLSWNIGKGFSLYANYYYSVTYPRLDFLSPIQYNIGNNLYRQGNPALRSAPMHYVNAELGFKGLLKLIFTQKFSSRDICDYYIIGDDYVTQTYTNSDYRHGYVGLEGNFDLTHGFNLSATTAYQWYSRKSDSTSGHKGRTWLVDTQLSYFVSKIKLLAYAQYFLRHDKLPLLQGMEYNQQETLAIGLNKSFLQGRISLGLTGTIPVSVLSKLRWKEIEIPGYKNISYCDDRTNQSLLLLNLRISLGNNRSTSRKRGLDLETEK